MASANVYHFSIGSEKHTFEIDIPPNAHGHSLRVTIDSTKNKGLVIIIRNTNTSVDDNNDPGCDYNCDTYPTDHSCLHNEQTLVKSMGNLCPFSAQPASPSRAAAYYTSHSVRLDPGKPVKTAEQRMENSGQHHATRQDAVSSPRNPKVYMPDFREEDGLPTWAELAARARLDSKGCTDRSVQNTGQEHHDCQTMGQEVPNQEHDMTPTDNSSHSSNLYVPFHRLPALDRVDGDRFPQLFAVLMEFRCKYPLSTNSSHGINAKEWWAVCKGYEISVFCDSWPYIQALTGPVNGFQKKAVTWRQALAYYNNYKRKSNTYFIPWCSKKRHTRKHKRHMTTFSLSRGLQIQPVASGPMNVTRNALIAVPQEHQVAACISWSVQRSANGRLIASTTTTHIERVLPNEEVSLASGPDTQMNLSAGAESASANAEADVDINLHNPTDDNSHHPNNGFHCTDDNDLDTQINTVNKEQAWAAQQCQTYLEEIY
ncbi:hypothetical protein BDN71DRAFT_1563616 [Pleurotus eryngii]|uniref:Uncharacterized protein n=1 Tax=Pleurotus eryngii TaxID=5323 RepID=A0A9P5ZUJ5_PLEER|nr:hypothetical protein BDN71DRAFT_1563616 [Pleurotus eryngii]